MSSANVDEKDLQDEDAIICICGSEVDDNATIQCDGCGRWQHMRCVGIDPAVVDLDDLVYHCDKCDPRPLDVDAAKAYIERFRREEAQSVQPRPRRGRGKGSGRRGGSASSPGSRLDARRQKQKPPDSDDTDDPSAGHGKTGQRDYEWLNDYIVTELSTSWMGKHVQDYPSCPSGLEMQILSTVIKPVADSQGIVRGLFTERDAPSNAFVGRYLGMICTRAEYEGDATNQYERLRGPLPHVAFVQQSDLVIDARRSGCETRYIRKSCQPNCILVPLVVEQSASENGFTWEFLIALKEDIKRGEEITIGHQWGVDNAQDLPGLSSSESLNGFARAVQETIGECACLQPPDICQVRRWVSTPPQAPSRKRSPSNDATEQGVETSQGSKTPVATNSEVPMTREERKIQMAIARMENADAPKVKRRRRDTGDETNRPTHSRRASAMKDDDAEITVQHAKRQTSPAAVPSAKSNKTHRSSIKSRAKLIRSPSPEYNINQTVPRKVLWLRQYSEERALGEEQRLKVAEQAREATARLARETTRKRQELEAQAREEREEKERVAEVRRKQAEREAKEALQRAREREIWGDHPVAPPAAAVTARAADEKTSDNTAASETGRHPGSSPAPKPESPGSMGPPQLPRDSSQASPPPAVVPKIVRKLSVSEYMRQKKERQASEASPSPSTESFRVERDANGATRQSDRGEDKSDGEIEAGEVQVKKEVSQVQLHENQAAQRNDFQSGVPTAPKGTLGHHAQSQVTSPGPLLHPSRMFQNHNNAVPYSSHGNFQNHPRHSFQPNNRPTNGYGSNNAYPPPPPPPPMSNPASNFQRNSSIPTGPKSTRPPGNPDSQQSYH